MERPYFFKIIHSEKIQHTVEIDLFTDSKLIFRLCEIIKQKLKDYSTSQTSAFYLEIRKTEGQMCAALSGTNYKPN